MTRGSDPEPGPEQSAAPRDTAPRAATAGGAAPGEAAAGDAARAAEGTGGGAPGEGGAASSPWAVLVRHADFRRLLAGNTVSLLGSSVTTVALPLTAVVHLGASATEMGVLGALGLLPHLLLGLPAGVWIDRVPYRRAVVVADAVRVGLLGAVPVLAVFGGLRMWHLYVVVTLAGTAALVESVAAQSFTPQLVPRERLLAAAAGPFALVVAVVVLAQLLRGAGPSLYGVNQQTFRQALIPAELLSRANATWRFLAYGGQSLGALAGGAAAAALGLRATLVVTSCVMLAGTAIGAASPLRSLRRL
ncbi:MFS transporter [Nonomuraea sp. FMUSA5-5]|uniref:MFS transporter n=1 Tax=Nonomuraea composti TaxID=2720023 RepID=A0ABX1BLS7_9ACTN|nr:MFS transporter [Nonomuraea sp. FMUSA5-5]NJP97257.1 MFS transporter [Nonomuraea sp. FMUSA5-5]